MANRTGNEQLQSLLVELAPRLEADRKLDRQLDRHLARRFNVFEYVRTDELGLSRVIADLLDPEREHGQGTAFLEAMLETFPQTRGRFNSLRSTLANPITVRTERPTDTGGRIDISVDIPDGDGSFCLAFENKPYAPQDAGQVTAYLSYLGKQYPERFLLVYVPPSGEGPRGRHLPPENRELWENRFVVMPYHGQTSLGDWFATCRERCEAEGVRAFLRDAELFCENEFGEAKMTANQATKTAREYLLENSRHLPAALAIHDAWMLVRHDVCKRFLEHLRDEIDGRIRKELPDADCHVGCHYGHEEPYSNFLWISRDSWKPYESPGDHHRDGRTSIRLEAWAERGRGGPNAWGWGVCSPKNRSEMTTAEQERRDQLCGELQKKGLGLRTTVWWPQYEYLKRYADWYPLVPDLHEECEQGGGPITTYLADNLLSIAAKAIPAINQVEDRDRR